jgi:hypothetical protein
MCIFTGSVSAVSSTAIFARPGDLGRQVLVYRMALITRTEVGMVLPLPVPPGSADNAVQFIDLSDDRVPETPCVLRHRVRFLVF